MDNPERLATLVHEQQDEFKQQQQQQKTTTQYVLGSNIQKQTQIE